MAERTDSLKYDAFGRRVEKVSSSTTSIYIYDGDNLIEETNAVGSAVARYSQGLNIDEPLAMLRSSATSYYHADGLGSITSLSNSSGANAATYTYDSFGNLTASTGSLTNPFRYTAREFDPETSLYYYRARYYDPSVGRFLGEDPIRFYGGIDFYTYVRNGPIGKKDPLGLSETPGGSCANKRCRDNFLRNAYGPLGNFLADTAVPEFSALSLFTNFSEFAKGSALSLAAKAILAGGPWAYGKLLTTTGTNMMQYPGLVGAGADAVEAGAFWTTTGATLGSIVAVGVTAISAFATTADLYARWACRDVQ